MAAVPDAEGTRPRETPSRLTSAWCEAGVRWDVLTAVAVAVDGDGSGMGMGWCEGKPVLVFRSPESAASTLAIPVSEHKVLKVWTLESER